MMKKAVLTALIAAIVLTGCGYRMVITGTKAAFKIYPIIDNKSYELDATTMFNDAVKLYLASINALGSATETDYIGEFNLLTAKFTGDSDTSSTTSVNAKISVEIIIRDKEGKTVYTKTLRASENYSSGDSSNDTNENRNEALNAAVNNLLMVFRNEFEHNK